MDNKYIFVCTKGKNIRIVKDSDKKVLDNISNKDCSITLDDNLEKLLIWRMNEYKDVTDNVIKEYKSGSISKANIQKLNPFMDRIIKYCVNHTSSKIDLQSIFGENMINLCKSFMNLIGNDPIAISKKYSTGTKSQKNIYKYLKLNNLIDGSTEVDKLKSDIKAKNVEINNKNMTINKLKSDIGCLKSEISDLKSKLGNVDNITKPLIASVSDNLKVKDLNSFIDLLQNAIFFDSNKKGLDSNSTCKISVKNINKYSILPLVVDSFLLDSNGNLELPEVGLDNNIGELVGFYYALKIANIVGAKTVVGDSRTAMVDFVKYDKNKFNSKLDSLAINSVKLPDRYYKLYTLIHEELSKFKNANGNILWIKDMLNPAD